MPLLANKSLGSRLALIFVVVSFGVSAVWTAAFSYFQYRDIRKRAIGSDRSLIQALSVNIRHGVFAQDKGILADEVSGFIGVENVAAVKVFNSKCEEIYNQGKSPGVITSPCVTGVAPGQSAMREQGDVMIFTTPVVMERTSKIGMFYGPGHEGYEVIGYVSLALDTRTLRKEMDAMFARNLAAEIVLMMIGYLVIWTTVRRAVKPLADLNSRLREMGNSNDVEKLPVVRDDEIGELTRSFNVMIDQRKNLENKLYLARKMEMIGTFAAGVAHDFNNIISSALGSVYIIRNANADSELGKYVGYIAASLHKMSELVRGLLLFSSKGKVNFIEFDMKDLVMNFEGVIRSGLKEGVQAEFVYNEPGKCTIKGDKTQLERMLSNLVSNAQDAVDGEGLIRICVTKDNGDVVLTVADNGAGMDNDTMRQSFDLFFTTKEPGKGTGLGLPIVYGIVEQHGGKMDVKSQPGEGSVFTVRIPAMDQGAL